MKVLAICGSLQAKSGNLALLKRAATLVPPDVDLVIFDGLRELPHFNPDVEASGVPESVTQWRQALAASDAVLIASPEYGFSLPGVLKNGIDWVIGSGELEKARCRPDAALLHAVGPLAQRHAVPRQAIDEPRHRRHAKRRAGRLHSREVRQPRRRLETGDGDPWREMAAKPRKSRRGKSMTLTVAGPQ